MAGVRVDLTEAQRVDLDALLASPTTSARVANRARIILALAQDRSLKEVRESLGVSAPTIRLWRDRFLSEGIAGLADRPDPPATAGELTRLLDATERTISKRGFCATRVADIASEAGVSSSLITYYFDSRQETLVRAMLHANQRAATVFHEALVAGGRVPTQRLAAFVERVLPDKGSQRDEYLLELDLLAHARQYPEFVDIWNDHQSRWVDVLAVILRDGIADGSFAQPSASVNDFAQAVLAMVDGFGHQLSIGSTMVSRRMMKAAVTAYLADALRLPIEHLG